MLTATVFNDQKDRVKEKKTKVICDAVKSTNPTIFNIDTMTTDNIRTKHIM
jgi:hypothetical protein